MTVLKQAPDQDLKVDWQSTGDAELIEHILTRYHDRHRKELPELIRLSQRVERVHGGHPACPAGLSDHLETLQEELEAHMQKEERVLFPMISRGMSDVALGPVRMMRYEHEEHERGLKRLREITHDLELPEGACTTWQTLYQGLTVLVQDLEDHIDLENRVLFARIDAGEGAAHG